MRILRLTNQLSVTCIFPKQLSIEIRIHVFRDMSRLFFRCVLRILPPDDSKSQCQLGMKFGCHPKYAKNLLQVAKELDLDVIGVRYVNKNVAVILFYNLM